MRSAMALNFRVCFTVLGNYLGCLPTQKYKILIKLQTKESLSMVEENSLKIIILENLLAALLLICKVFDFERFRENRSFVSTP